MGRDGFYVVRFASSQSDAATMRAGDATVIHEGVEGASGGDDIRALARCGHVRISCRSAVEREAALKAYRLH